MIPSPSDLVFTVMVRFDTYNASAHLVRQIENSHVATVAHDGGDNVLIALHSGELISIYLIETVLPPYEMRATLHENSAANVHTLFILWGEMFLPEHGDYFEPAEWMHALLKLYNNKIYAFNVYGKDIRIFPVYFERTFNGLWHVNHQPDIDVTRLGVDFVELHTPDSLRGMWRIADFDHEAASHAPRGRYEAALSPALRDAFRLLGVAPENDPGAVKAAYWRLARLYHPDVNRSPEAHRRMQAINNAYALIASSYGIKP